MLYQTNNGGTSGAAEPNWLTTNITDNTVTWVPYNAAPTLVLQDRLTTNNYSIDATILHNRYIYVTGTEGKRHGDSPDIWPITVIGGYDGTVTWTCSGAFSGTL